jgi:hypothetical protein
MGHFMIELPSMVLGLGVPLTLLYFIIFLQRIFFPFAIQKEMQFEGLENPFV